jgi:peptide-methionine (S)-S-oxide reductase
MKHAKPLLALTALCALAAGIGFKTVAAEAPHVIPAPAVDEAVGTADTETAVLAGGCFWGVQGVFQHVKGVTNAVSGYAGGDKRSANYEIVSSGVTGHAESVSVTFDPHQITYGKILQIYFSVAHDPTELNRQGPDSGTQYRSALFPMNDDQAKVAEAYIAQLDKSKIFSSRIVTKIEPGRNFYPAEGYHQNYLTLNPTAPYIVYNDLPKVAALKALFPDLYRDQPTRAIASR